MEIMKQYWAQNWGGGVIVGGTQSKFANVCVATQDKPTAELMWRYLVKFDKVV